MYLFLIIDVPSLQRSGACFILLAINFFSSSELSAVVPVVIPLLNNPLDPNFEPTFAPNLTIFPTIFPPF